LNICSLNSFSYKKDNKSYLYIYGRPHLFTILGNSDFVEAVLKEADEQLERRYRLQAEGFDLDRVAGRVAQVLDMPLEVVWEKSRRPKVAEARSLLCYWASKELAMSMTDLARRLNLTQPAISIAVRRGEKIVRENQYQLIDD
jgi:chromosomal replication initiation ATPase DnaA